jgi:pimeloyl-ACP methyl ester carboxylesterase
MNYFLTSQKIPVHVHDTGGDRPAVVLLHGYLETLSVWDDFVRRIERAVRVIRIDLPGHGLSGTAAINSVDFSAQVLYDVLQAQGIREAVVAGHSMGGYTALAFAERFPETTRGLCLFHSTPDADTPHKHEGRDREIALIRDGRMTLAIRQGLPRMFADDNRARFASVIEELSEIAEIHEPEGLIACLEGMKQRPDRNAFLSSFEKPLLFVFGAKDRYILPETAQQLAARFPQAQVLWLPNSGHNGFIEEPEAVAQRFLAFMEACSER